MNHPLRHDGRAGAVDPGLPTSICPLVRSRRGAGVGSAGPSSGPRRSCRRCCGPPPAVGLVVLALAVSAFLGLWGYRLYWKLTHGGSRKSLRDCLLAMVLAASMGGVLTVGPRPDWILHPGSALLWSRLQAWRRSGPGPRVRGVVGRQGLPQGGHGFRGRKIGWLLGGFAGWTG